MAFVVEPVLPASALPLRLVGLVYAGWGAVYLALGLAYLKWSGRRPRQLVRGAAILYQATLWVLRLIGDRASRAQALWTRSLIFTLVFLGVVYLLTAVDASQEPFERR